MQIHLKKNFSFNDLLLIGALFLAFGLGWNTISAMQRNYRLQQKYDRLAAEVELQELQNQNLRYNIEYLKTDDYKELAARDKFNKALPGEHLVYLPNNAAATQAPVAKTSVKQQATQQKGWQANVKAWWEFLRGKESAILRAT